MDAITQAKAAQTSCRQDQAIELTGIQLLEAGDHIAAHIFEGEVRVVVPELGQTAQRAGAHHGTLRQGGQGEVFVFGMHHQGIGRIFPLGDAAKHQPFWKVGGQIFKAMNSDISPVHQHLSF